eukprot:m.362398 g.362398  ORF g.362398 m.362398 type:complete len:420 (+) comp20438_c0_seq1:138-1397(+)
MAQRTESQDERLGKLLTMHKSLDITMMHVASLGDLEALQFLIENGHVSVNIARRKGKNTALHTALAQNKLAVVPYLLSQGADINARNDRGVTPLMIAVTASKGPAIIRTLLDAGADPTIKNWRYRKTALELAHDRGYEAGVKLLEKALEDWHQTHADDPVDPSGKRECPICGQTLRERSRIDFLQDKFKRGQLEPNRYLASFLTSPVADTIAKEERYHFLADKHHLRKEVTESMSIVEAIEAIMDTQLGGCKRVQVVDLCAGKSLTSAIFGLKYPESSALAVDIMPLASSPHFEGNVAYLEADIMKDEFEATLKDCLDPEQPAILVGMHLCGQLSIRAIELFERIDRFTAIVLSPCCFPKFNSGNDFIKKLQGSPTELEKYETWSQHLHELLDPLAKSTSIGRDEFILSTRNAIITGFR